MGRVGAARAAACMVNSKHNGSAEVAPVQCVHCRPAQPTVHVHGTQGSRAASPPPPLLVRHRGAGKADPPGHAVPLRCRGVFRPSHRFNVTSRPTQCKCPWSTCQHRRIASPCRRTRSLPEPAPVLFSPEGGRHFQWDRSSLGLPPPDMLHRPGPHTQGQQSIRELSFCDSTAADWMMLRNRNTIK